MSGTGLKIRKHIRCHVRLHRALDNLVADWIGKTGRLPSKSSVLRLMEWSHKQTRDPE